MVNGAEKAAPVLPLSDALVRFPGHQLANELDDLDYDPDKHHAHPNHVGVAALVKMMATWPRPVPPRVAAMAV